MFQQIASQIKMIKLISYYIIISGDNFNVENYLQKSLLDKKIKISTNQKMLSLSLFEITESALIGQDILLKTLEDEYEVMKKYEASEVVIYYTFEYNEQCNLEFDIEHLKKINKIEAVLAISCYTAN